MSKNGECAKKMVYIWGAGYYGTLTAMKSKEEGVEIKGFIDKNARLIKTTFGLPVIEPSEILSNSSRDYRIIIAINNSVAIREITTILQSKGFAMYNDFNISFLLNCGLNSSQSSYQSNIKYIQRNDEEYVYAQRMNDPLHLLRYGYKVYSQNDEDGIIAEIFNRIGTTNKTFVEFGVQNGLESNTHYLLHKGWKGLWIEGSDMHCLEIQKLFSTPIKNGALRITNAFIDRDNINSLIRGGGISGMIDLLSIDIDGNDYWVWESINCVQPRVVVIEYNAKFPPDYEWIMKYNKNHIWDGDGDNYGVSLKSLEVLGSRLNYQIVYANGVNAFFVKQELAGNLFILPATAENLYCTCRRNTRYISGNLSKEYIGSEVCKYEE